MDFSSANKKAAGNRRGRSWFTDRHHGLQAASIATCLAFSSAAQDGVGFHRHPHGGTHYTKLDRHCKHFAGIPRSAFEPDAPGGWGSAAGHRHPPRIVSTLTIQTDRRREISLGYPWLGGIPALRAKLIRHWLARRARVGLEMRRVCDFQAVSRVAAAVSRFPGLEGDVENATSAKSEASVWNRATTKGWTALKGASSV